MYTTQQDAIYKDFYKVTSIKTVHIVSHQKRFPRSYIRIAI
jgi:hypothetical protein